MADDDASRGKWRGGGGGIDCDTDDAKLVAYLLEKTKTNVRTNTTHQTLKKDTQTHETRNEIVHLFTVCFF